MAGAIHPQNEWRQAPATIQKPDPEQARVGNDHCSGAAVHPPMTSREPA